ncbi:MAG: hypothetical protein M1814_000287 [Vezdaea aestivalis]|nr:MAG: hypothetical protein M1814_000287 [Vezdaea aestivalis]
MASSSSKQRQAYHQDYVARIRYSNALPPPPNPPKLLDIPNTGLASGQYTSAGFTSRLAREQPLNIEADAELGMPLDLVGMPGIFDGDESSIQPPPHSTPLHASDRALLRPLATLGKPTTISSGVSFLRRTEYISSEQGKTSFHSTTSKGLVSSTGKHRARRAPSGSRPANRNNPLTILRSINKGFDVSYPANAYTGPDSGELLQRPAVELHERKNWDDPLHPRNRSLKLVSSHPLAPDLSAIPDAGGYTTTKFATPPIPMTDAYDARLDVAMLHPLEESSSAKAPYYDYDLLLPESSDQLAALRSALHGPNAPAEGERSELFRYKRVRVYETAKTETHAEDPYDEVVLAIKKNGPGCYYPILQRSVIRPRRTQNMARLGMAGAEEDDVAEDSVEYMDVSVREPNVDEVEQRALHTSKLEAGGGEAV